MHVPYTVNVPEGVNISVDKKSRKCNEFSDKFLKEKKKNYVYFFILVSLLTADEELVVG